MERKNIMLGTAGHVDHGKTAVVRVLTGCNTDTLAEEQKRGLTIDLGFAPCRMADQSIVGIIDVPGHVDFIRNMVAGAHGIDVVIFVVAADDGVMPQTREHLDILTLMGARGGIVALTKIDLVDASMRDLVVQDVRDLLAGTFLAQAPICPVSNITGKGYDQLLAALNAAVAACPPRSTGGLFRMWVEDVYTIHGFGTVATGIPRSGQVAAGQHLRLLPAGLELRVRALEVYGQEAALGRSGECVAVNLVGAEAADLKRGMVLVEGDMAANAAAPAGAFGQPVVMAEAHLQVLDHVAKPLQDYTEVRLHVGTAQTTARLAILEGKEIAPGHAALVQLRLRQPMSLAAGERFVIRGDSGGPSAGRLTTIGGGRIVGTSNIRLRRNRPWTLATLSERLAALDEPAKWVEANLRQSAGPLTPAELAARAGRKPGEVQELLRELVTPGAAIEVGGKFAHAQHLVDLAERIKAELEKFHTENLMRVGADAADLAATLQADAGLMELAVARLIEQKVLHRQGTVLQLRGRGPQVSQKDLELLQAIETAMKNANLSPPTLPELATAMGADEARAGKLLALLADQGVLVRLDEKLYMHRDAVEHARSVALELFRKAGGFETVEYRDALCVSRKFAVPLLDYFDTVRWTVRSGSRRTPGAEAKDRLKTT